MRVENLKKKEKLLNEVDNQIDYVKKDPVAIAYANVLQEQKKLKDQLKQKNLS